MLYGASGMEVSAGEARGGDGDPPPGSGSQPLIGKSLVGRSLLLGVAPGSLRFAAIPWLGTTSQGCVFTLQADVCCWKLALMPLRSDEATLRQRIASELAEWTASSSVACHAAVWSAKDEQQQSPG